MKNCGFGLEPWCEIRARRKPGSLVWVGRRGELATSASWSVFPGTRRGSVHGGSLSAIHASRRSPVNASSRRASLEAGYATVRRIHARRIQSRSAVSRCGGVDGSLTDGWAAGLRGWLARVNQTS